MNRHGLYILVLLILFGPRRVVYGQDSAGKKTTQDKDRRNIIRYNLSGGILFGFDHYVVFGYEWALGPHQSISMNIGRAALPYLTSFSTDSFSVSQDRKNTGFNVSLDYRFYLARENKYHAPHGLYVGPYFSFNNFKRENDWSYQHSGSATQLFTSNIDFDIYTAGGDLGYQFILWKRVALDFVMIGPGWSHYNLKATLSGDLSEEQRANLQNAVKQLITQKFPGMNYVFADKQFNGNGRIGTWSIGYRYLIHIGFLF